MSVTLVASACLVHCELVIVPSHRRSTTLQIETSRPRISLMFRCPSVCSATAVHITRCLAISSIACCPIRIRVQHTSRLDQLADLPVVDALVSLLLLLHAYITISLL